MNNIRLLLVFRLLFLYLIRVGDEVFLAKKKIGMYLRSVKSYIDINTKECSTNFVSDTKQIQEN